MFSFRVAAPWFALAALCSGLAPAAEEATPQLEWQGRGFSEYALDLKAADAAVRADAVLALGVLSVRCRSGGVAPQGQAPAPEKFVELLLPALRDGDALVRRYAASALGRVAAREAEVRARVSQALADRLEEDEDGGVRANAVEAVANFFAPQPAASRAPLLDPWLPILARAARDADPCVRRGVLSALGLWGLNKAEVREALEALLRDGDAATATRALEAVEKGGKACASLLPTLVEVWFKTPGPNPDLVLRALSAVGWDDAVCLPALAQALRRHGKGFYAAGFRALGARGRAAVPALLEFLSSVETRLFALDELIRIGAPDAAEALAGVRPLLAEADKATTMRARAAVVALTLDAEELSALLLDPDPAKRTEAAPYLAARKTVPAAFLPVLKKAYEQAPPGNPVPRQILLRTLAKAGPQAAETVLGLLDEKDAAMQTAFVEVLTALGPAAGAAVPFAVRAVQAAKAYEAQGWRHVLAVIASPEQLAHWLGEQDDVLAEEIRKTLLAQKTAPAQVLFDALRARYERAKDAEKNLWVEPLFRCATLEQLVAAVRACDDALWVPGAWRELGRRGGAAGPVLEALKKIESEAKTELQSLQKKIGILNGVQGQARDAITRIEKAAAAEKSVGPAPESKR